MMDRGFKIHREPEPTCGGYDHSCHSAYLEISDGEIVRHLASIELMQYARTIRRLKGRIETTEAAHELRRNLEKEAWRRYTLPIGHNEVLLAAKIRGIEDVHCHPMNLGFGKGGITKPKRSRAVSAKLRFAVLQRDGFRCVYCGATSKDAPLHVDHVRPFALGGKCSADNLATSCADCNLGKSDRPLNATS